MKSRQVGIVLIALIVIGIAGLIARAVSSGPERLFLSGLLPIAVDVNDKITIREADSEAVLIRVGETWTIDNQPVFVPKLSQFWAAVAGLNGAQLIATNPKHHELMGVADGQGTVVSFYRSDFRQEEFIVGNWTPDVRLCYLRRPAKDDVHGIECPNPATTVFDPDPDGWLNPVVVSIPGDEVEAVSFRYPGEEFVLATSEGRWMVLSDDGEANPADPFQVVTVLRTLELLLARGFVDDEEAKGLRFDVPDALIRVATMEGASNPNASLRFLKRDDTSYYLKIPTRATVYIVGQDVIDALLKKRADFLP